MRKSHSRIGSRLVRAGIASAATTAAVLAGVAAPAMAAVPVLTLSSTSGASGAALPFTAQSTTPWLGGVSTVGVLFSVPACPAAYSTTQVAPTTSAGLIDAASVTKISNNKAAISPPSGAAGTGLTSVANATATKWNVCAYNSATDASGTLIATGSYSVAPGVTLSAISPGSGPSLGGNTITISGSSLPATTAGILGATLGGVPLTNVTAVNASSFTATAPTHASSTTAVPLTITTAAGTQTLASAYTYSNGIVVSPNTSPPAASAAADPTLDITGVGFSALNFGALLSTGAHVFLTANPGYSSAGASTSAWTTAPVTDCTSQLVISDTELVCTLNLHYSLTTLGATTGAAVSPGTYSVQVVANGQPQATTANVMATDISSGSTFTVSNY
jgi:hypothetical protein